MKPRLKIERLTHALKSIKSLGVLLPKRTSLSADAPIPARALYLWKERPDLQEVFDLNTPAGRQGLVWWYLRHGFSELGLKFDSSDSDCAAAVNVPHPNAKRLSFVPVTWLMHSLINRSPFTKRQVLRYPNGQERFLAWFFARGLMQANLAEFLTIGQARALVESSSATLGLPRLLQCIWLDSPVLQNRFLGPADPEFQAWCTSEDGAREFPILSHRLIALSPPPVRRSCRLKEFGVNLFGHAHGRSGVSEDVRMAAKVLTEAGIPFALHDVLVGAAALDSAAMVPQGPRLRYAINLFCLPAEGTAAAVINVGRETIADHYNIGFWPWELPEFPEFWRHAYDFVDEIWAASRFTYEAFCHSSPTPVYHMPFAVDAVETDRFERRDFGLPDATFLFGFAFDGFSSFARKSPLAVIRAFDMAFADKDAAVGLVVKGIRVADNPQWEKIVAAAASDPRIHLVTQSLPRGRLLDLWRSLDCFVSLHRSEGFGRNIAEAMLVGKPAIATRYSGNMDFTQDATAALVPYSLRRVQEGEYSFGNGQVWAEPDIASAAGMMRRILQNAELRDRLAQAGREIIEKQYSPEVVAAAWRPALLQRYMQG